MSQIMSIMHICFHEKFRVFPSMSVYFRVKEKRKEKEKKKKQKENEKESLKRKNYDVVC